MLLLIYCFLFLFCYGGGGGGKSLLDMKRRHNPGISNNLLTKYYEKTIDKKIKKSCTSILNKKTLKCCSLKSKPCKLIILKTVSCCCFGRGHLLRTPNRTRLLEGPSRVPWMSAWALNTDTTVSKRPGCLRLGRVRLVSGVTLARLVMRYLVQQPVGKHLC